MLSVLMVCHGNICRSPLAEFLLRERIKEENLPLSTASAAVSSEEEGNPIYPPVRQLLQACGIDCSHKHARKMTAADLTDYDLIIAMDKSNLRIMERSLGPLPDKVKLLLDFVPGREGEDIADPWYSGDFTTCLMDIEEGIDALVHTLKNEHLI